MIDSPSPSPLLLGLLFALAIGALVALVRALLRTLREARLCSLPLVPEQAVRFAQAGRVVLCLEGPRFAPRTRKLKFALRPLGGASLDGRPVLFRMVTSGLRSARITLRSFDLAYPGEYQLTVDGIDAREATRHQVVFMRPHAARSVSLIVGMVIAAGIAVTSLVFLLLSLVPSAQAIDPGTASGYVEVQGARIELSHSSAQLRRATTSDGIASPSELRVALADQEVPQSALAGPQPIPLLALAHDSGVRGVLLRLDPRTNAETAQMIVLARAADGIDSETGRADPAVYTVRLKSIRISDVRVSGQIDCGRADAVHCAARFSAPLFVE